MGSIGRRSPFHYRHQLAGGGPGALPPSTRRGARCPTAINSAGGPVPYRQNRDATPQCIVRWPIASLTTRSRIAIEEVVNQFSGSIGMNCR